MKLMKVLVTLMAVMVLTLAQTRDTSVMAGQGPGTVTAKQGQPVYYIVKDGDCLWSVAETFGIEIQLLADCNGLNPESELSTDQRLILPAGKAVSYHVLPGDTLWSIAPKFDVSIEALAAGNRFLNEGILEAGTNLIIPLAGKNPDSGDAKWLSEGNGEEPTDAKKWSLQLEIWPVKGIVSSAYGPRDSRMHEGLDIAAAEGRPIRAVFAGTVVFAGRRGTYGKTVIINHGLGNRSLYAHALELEVAPGDYVEQGQIVARVGSTGHSTGPHLHLELLHRGVPLNPQKYLPHIESSRI